MTTSEWDDYADGWDDDPAARAYAVAAFESLTDLLTDAGVELSGLRVCDFGCGTGLLTERLVASGALVDAVDSSPAMLAVLDAKIAAGGWDGVVTRAELDDTADYDLVVCSSVCGFLDDYPGSVAELVSRLVPGGRFVQWDWEAEPDADDPHGLTSEAIASALGAAGLDSIRVGEGFRVAVDEMTMAPLMGSGRRPTG